MPLHVRVEHHAGAERLGQDERLAADKPAAQALTGSVEPTEVKLEVTDAQVGSSEQLEPTSMPRPDVTAIGKFRPTSTDQQLEQRGQSAKQAVSGSTEVSTVMTLTGEQQNGITRARERKDAAGK